jgi:hypothetical protein
MTEMVSSPSRTIDIEELGFDRGAHLLIKRALSGAAVGERLGIKGRDPALAVHLRAWCRAQGHEIIWPETVSAAANNRESSPLIAWVVRGSASGGRWRGAEQAGRPDSLVEGAVTNHPPATWGLAARGALVEAGGPEFFFSLDSKEQVWAEGLARLYAQAAASQWNPATAIDWDDPFELAPEIESAVVQIMTYLIENENAALLVPARFIAQVHPHFREVMQLLAIQVADEARHVEVFTRRALLQRRRTRVLHGWRSGVAENVA